MDYILKSNQYAEGLDVSIKITHNENSKDLTIFIQRNEDPDHTILPFEIGYYQVLLGAEEYLLGQYKSLVNNYYFNTPTVFETYTSDFLKEQNSEESNAVIKGTQTTRGGEPIAVQNEKLVD